MPTNTESDRWAGTSYVTGTFSVPSPKRSSRATSPVFLGETSWFPFSRVNLDYLLGGLPDRWKGCRRERCWVQAVPGDFAVFSGFRSRFCKGEHRIAA